MIKILYSYCYDLFPTRQGGLIRVYRLAEELSRSEDIHVTLLYPTHRPSCEQDRSNTPRLTLYPVRLPDINASRTKKIICGLPRGIPPFVTGTYHQALESALAKLLQQQKFDAILLSRGTMVAYQPTIRTVSNAPIIYDLHDVETYRIRHMPVPRHRQTGSGKLIQWLDRLLVESWERALLTNADGIVVVSSDERQRALEITSKISHPEQLLVVPNGVAALPKVWQPGRQSLVMVGSLIYEPNWDAAHWIVYQVMPLIWAKYPEIRLIIAGAANPQTAVGSLQSDPRISVSLNVPDITEIYKQAVICIIGVQSGGGTALKLLEALMLGVPVVTTSFGMRGYDVMPPVEVANDTQAMVSKIIELLNDIEKQKQRSEEGRTFASQGYTWDKLGVQLTDFLRRIVAEGKIDKL